MFGSGGKKRDASSMLQLHPSAPSKSRSKTRGRASRGRMTSVRVAKARATSVASATGDSISDPSTVSAISAIVDGDDESSVTSLHQEKDNTKRTDFTRAAHSIMNIHRMQRTPLNEPGNRAAAGQEVPASAARQRDRSDPWSAVMNTVVRKVTRLQGGGDSLGLGVGAGAGALASSKRVSLAQMLKSREMKNLVKQALVAKQFGRSAPAPEGQSSVMEHWVKTAKLRRQQNGLDDDESGSAGSNAGNKDNGADVDDVDEEDEDPDGIQSGFDLENHAKTRQMYGRTLILEESCRRAFAQEGEQRSQMDLQSLRAWFQMTKLKIATDFERLQPSELDLLCRRMVCVSFHPDEVVFRQGEEGDALYLVFSGTVEVRVSQRILGELVEVTVCELAKGDYFGERALLSNDVRAATVIAKTAAELVKITRSDYNLMLKNDQLEFLSRMQIANGIGVPRSVQQTQREYVRVLSKNKHARSKADVDMLSEYLQTLKFFRTLPKSFVRELCSVVDFLTLPAGACVFREGEVGDQFFIIFSGSVDVNISSKDFRGNAQQTKLINLTEGSHFGELALMKGRGVRSATVLTREECKLLVICEKDYNTTLRRMQKKDMAKRVAVLDQIPMFQTPEWTGELLKELSYVLLEQRLATGSVLYQQGDRALHVYFVVRGELVVTKEIIDPFSQAKHEVFVERIGRYCVVGDDAAAGINFNEVIHREVTVSASTPVEVLMLSKYDVFHRLSRSARETLRAAAHSHADNIVYLDRLHKSQKWKLYKQKVLREHVNHERIEKILPSAVASRAVGKPNKNILTVGRLSRPHQSSAVKLNDISNTGTTETMQEATAATEGVTLPVVASLSSPGIGKRSALPHAKAKVHRMTVAHALVPANELLLLSPEAKAMQKCFHPNQTIGHYVASFNADAPPSVARQRQLEGVLLAERHRQTEVLNEGNPLAYFHMDNTKKPVPAPAPWKRTTPHSLDDPESHDSEMALPDALASPSVLPQHIQSFTARNAVMNATLSPRTMNQILNENFIFSRPVRPPEEGRKPSQGARRPRLLQRKTTQKDIKQTSTSVSSTPSGVMPSRIDAARKQAERLCEGDFVLVSFPCSALDKTVTDRGGAGISTTFQILQCVRSAQEASEVVGRLQSCQPNGVDGGQQLDNAASSMFYVLPLKKFALMPQATRCKDQERVLQLQQMHMDPASDSDTDDGGDNNSESGLMQTLDDDSKAISQYNLGAVFASFEEVSLRSLPLTADAQAKADLEASRQEDRSRNIPGGGSSAAVSIPCQHSSRSVGENSPTGATVDASSTANLFAVASVVLSKREVANSPFEEPFLSVHALFPSELEATNFALNLTPRSQQLKHALLCVIPTGKEVCLADAHNWCVQVELTKREKHGKHPPSPPTATRTSVVQPVASTMGGLVTITENAPKGEEPASNPVPVTPKWKLDRDEGKRLHQFICARMGAPVRAPEKSRGEENGGFTPKPLVSLEDKLNTLHDYLKASSSVGTGRAGGGGVSILKYRQVKRFGSIMRSRIAGAPRPTGGNTGGIGSNNNSLLQG